MSYQPGNCLKWMLNQEDIWNLAEKAMRARETVHNSLGQLQEDEVTYENVIQALADNDRQYEIDRKTVYFVPFIFPSKKVREASVAADKMMAEFDVDMSMRQDVFDNILAFQKKSIDMQPEAKRYTERLIKMGKRNGLHLSKDIQNKVKVIRKRICELCIQFNKHLNEDDTFLLFSEEALVGLPISFVQHLEHTDNGMCKVNLKYPHYFPSVRMARNPETRKKIETAFNSRSMKENTPLLEELIQLRDERAKLLSYPSHVAFMVELLMSKTPENVSTFLNDLMVELYPLVDKEMKEFLQYKREECIKYGYHDNGQIDLWDIQYYMHNVLEIKFGVDHQKLSQYLPLTAVTDGLFSIYKHLLGLHIEKIENPDVWHEDVEMFRVKDKKTSDLLGYFYLDLFPRESRFSHACAFDLQPGCSLPDGTRQPAVSALVTNFTKPTSHTPTLLRHDEVRTFFHEFGHIMHQICARTEFALFSGSKVERDFIEAPSKMFENWIWDKEALPKMSAHYQDGSPLPEDLLEKLMKSKVANAGITLMRLIHLATFDQVVHSMTKVDTAATMSQLSEKILRIPSIPGTNFAASFLHLVNDYDGLYYSYVWSEVFSADMFQERFGMEGIMNTKTGADYRKWILEPGGSVDAVDMLHNFLCRNPKKEAFLRSKGIQFNKQ